MFVFENDNDAQPSEEKELNRREKKRRHNKVEQAVFAFVFVCILNFKSFLFPRQLRPILYVDYTHTHTQTLAWLQCKREVLCSFTVASINRTFYGSL